MKYTIYKTTNCLNGKIYIGQHSTAIPNDRYLGSGNNLRKDIKLFGRDVFSKEVLYIFDTHKEMDDKEKELVTKEFCLREDTYNLVPGGNSNMKLTAEFRSIRGKLGRKAANAKGANINGSKRHAELLKTDPEYRAMFAAKTWDTRKGQTGTFTGKTHNEETKAKMSAAKRLSAKGSGNSQFGTCWMHKGGKNYKVKKEEVELYLEQDYIKGRVLKFAD